MDTIAQETVEFLYEENGGVPKDLRFPTLDDVKADLEKFSVDRLRKGQAVVVKSDLPCSRCGVRAMQKTQGLTGIVLDVDRSHELVQVECYLPSDGALVRFWYPIVFLEKPPKGFRKPSALRGVESVNIMVHRELLQSEAKLTSMYARCSCLPFLRLLPLALRVELLACTSFSRNLPGHAHSLLPEASLSSVSSHAHTDFFVSHQSLDREVSSWLRSSKQELLPAVKGICAASALSPESFAFEQFPVTESRVSMEIESPGAAFLLACCVREKSGGPSGTQYKFPWAKLCWHVGGQAKNGRMPLQEVARFPNELSPAGVGAHQYCGPTYPSLLLGTNSAHLRLGGCAPRPGQDVVVVGLPAALPTSLALLHSLVTLSCHQDTGLPRRLELCGCLSACVTPLINVLSGVECPPMIREKLFFAISSALEVVTDVVPADSGEEGGAFPFAAVPRHFFSAVESELKKVYCSESGQPVRGKDSEEKVKPLPQSGNVFQGGSTKFSTYFQTLLALFLSLDSYRSKYGVARESGSSSEDASKVEGDSSQESVLDLAGSLSPPSLESVRFSVSSMSHEPSADSEPMVASTSDSSEPPHSSTESCCSFRQVTSDEGPPPSAEKTEGEWLPCAKRVSRMLRRLATGSSVAATSSLADCLGSSLPATPYDRLLILTKFCPSADPEQVERDVMKVCRQHGGLYSVHVVSRPRQPQPLDDSERPLSTESDAVPPREVAGAILELCSVEKRAAVSGSLLSSDSLQGRARTLSVSQVSPALSCKDDEDANSLLREYLTSLLVHVSGEKQLTESCRQALLDIFTPVTKTEDSLPSLLRMFVESLGEDVAALSVLWREEEASGGESRSRGSFLAWAKKQCEASPLCVWSALFAVGYDLHFCRCGFFPDMAAKWELDSSSNPAVVLLVDSICRKLSVPSTKLKAHDINIADAELATPSLQPLQGLSLADLRLRFLLLQELNRQLCWLLPMVDLRVSYPLSLGTLFRQAAPILFYDYKVSFLHAILNASTHRALDQAPPEIKMDPLKSVGGLPSTSLATHFCQAARQVLTIPSPQLCVSLASGGDPTYAFNVRLAGEEVHGTSGSFRHFLWQAVRELQSPLLPIVMVCPSSAAGVNKNRYILVPGNMSYSQERLLHFFGQLLGVAIRADVPVALDLLPCFWKSLREETLTLDDIKDADWLTYSHTQRLLEAEDEDSFVKLAASLSSSVVGSRSTVSMGEREMEESSQRGLVFTYHTLSASVVELCKDGHSRPVRFADRHEYVEGIRSLRLEELACRERMAAIRCGLASIIPLQLLSIFTASDLDLRVCGVPDIDLDYLRRHTTYHVGLVESDRHIQFFWAAMESFSQEELRRFVKFACNQDRIPFGHPCRSNGNDTPTHVPPYPMKIAPPDGQDPPDSRYIRAETCMFLVKLPQYTTQELMTERLRYAINCREDPLSG